MALSRRDRKGCAKEINIATGFPCRPSKKEEHEERFRDRVRFSGRAPGPEKMGAVVRAVRSLEEMEDGRALIPLLFEPHCVTREMTP